MPKDVVDALSQCLGARGLDLARIALEARLLPFNVGSIRGADEAGPRCSPEHIGQAADGAPGRACVRGPGKRPFYGREFLEVRPAGQGSLQAGTTSAGLGLGTAPRSASRTMWL